MAPLGRAPQKTNSDPVVRLAGQLGAPFFYLTCFGICARTWFPILIERVLGSVFSDRAFRDVQASVPIGTTLLVPACPGPCRANRQQIDSHSYTSDRVLRLRLTAPLERAPQKTNSDLVEFDDESPLTIWKRAHLYEGAPIFHQKSLKNY